MQAGVRTTHPGHNSLAYSLLYSMRGEKEGNVLISVHTDDSTKRARAKTIFEQAGAEDISYTEEARV